MQILMFTNSYLPRIGGVPQSILSLRRELVRQGHAVLTVAPVDPAATVTDPDIVPVPVLARTRSADLPVPVLTRAARGRIAAFRPDLVHSHHPFLLGRTALHAAARLGRPLVYTFHTRYDLYARSAVHGGPLMEAAFRRMVLGYCRMADAVIAPSDSVRDMLLGSGLSGPVVTIPTAVDRTRVLGGDGAGLRARLGIEPGAFVLGHVGRLEAEKNLDHLGLAVAAFLRRSPDAIFLLGGDGARRGALLSCLQGQGVAQRVFWVGPLQGFAIADAYAAMDGFAFTSTSETQGLVVAEAQAAGVPVVALDSPGIREILGHGGGVILDRDSTVHAFAEALLWLQGLSQAGRDRLSRRARAAAKGLTAAVTARATLSLYEGLVRRAPTEARRGGLLASLSAELGLLNALLADGPLADVWCRDT